MRARIIRGSISVGARLQQGPFRSGACNGCLSSHNFNRATSQSPDADWREGSLLITKLSVTLFAVTPV